MKTIVIIAAAATFLISGIVLSQSNVSLETGIEKRNLEAKYALDRSIDPSSSFVAPPPVKLRQKESHKSTIALGDGQDIEMSYTGAADKNKLEDGTAKPLSVASADFDEDGVPDLISGYAGDGSFLLTINRGNVDAIYENTAEANERKARGVFTDAPFLSPATVFELPARPDLIGTGDFDADGHYDVVISAIGGQQLYWISGDGRGALSGIVQTIELDAPVSALTIGEVNRADGLADIIVGTGTETYGKVMVFEGAEGALRNEPEVFRLPTKPSALVVGRFDDSYEMDLAIAAGSELQIAHGRDRLLYLNDTERSTVKAAAVERFTMSFNIASIAVGDFSGTSQSEIALLSESGDVNIFSRRPKSNTWKTVIRRSANAAPESSRLNGQSAGISANESGKTLLRARVSIDGDDLLVIDRRQSQIEVIAGDSLKRRAGPNKSELVADSEFLEVDGPVAGVLPMRLNKHALDGLVVLKSGGVGPIAYTNAVANAVITVNSSAITDVRDSVLTLIEAVSLANGTLLKSTLTPVEQAQVNGTPVNPGLDEIKFSGVTSITMSPGFGDSITLDGTSVGRLEIKGQVSISRGNSSIRGLAVNNFSLSSAGISINSDSQVGSGNNFIENNYVGTDMSGTILVPSGSSNGIGLVGSSFSQLTRNNNNTIGGTAVAARNVIATQSVDIRISGNSAGNKVQGNYIGVNSTGLQALGTQGGGVLFTSGPDSDNQTIGGAVPGAGNVIGSSTGEGVSGTTSGNLIQGNLIGTDATGHTALGHQSNGVFLGSSSSIGNTIGGTSPSARNVISGTLSGNGISISGNSCLIQGNLIGTDVDGMAALPNRSGITTSGASGCTIGGSVTGARNIISGSSNGTAIALGSTNGDNNRVQGNYIGTNIAGTGNLGNNGSGISISGNNNLIGGTGAGESNLIAFGTGPSGYGVFVAGASGNAVRRNSIFGNSQRAILSTTANAAKQPNLAGTTGTLTGAAPGAYTIEFFTNDSCGSFDTVQAKNFFGEITANVDANGNATFNIPGGQFVTATANAPGFNTSMISNCIAGAASPAQIGFPTDPINFNAAVGSQPNPPIKTVTLTNTGGSPLNWQAAAGTTSGGSWLSVAPATAPTPLAPGQSTTLTITVNSNNLFSDLYTGSIILTAPGASNGPVTVAVNLMLSCPATVSNLNYLTDPPANCADTGDATANGATSVSELGLRQNGLSGIITYRLRSIKKADLVVRVFDQNDNRVGSSPTKTILRPPPDPIPLPTIETIFVPNEIASKNCHVLGGDDTSCGSSISLFPDSKSVYMQALMIDPNNGNIISRSEKVPYNIVPFKVELGTDFFSLGSFQPLDPSSVLVSGSSLTESLNLTLQSLRSPVIRVTSGLEDVNLAGAFKDTVLGEKSRTNGNCQPDDRYVRSPRVIIHNIYTETTTNPEAFFFEHSAWTNGLVPDDVDIVELRFGILLPNGLSALSEPVYLPVERIKIRSSNPNVSNGTLTPGNLQNFVYKVEYNVARPGTSMVAARTRVITNVAFPQEEILLAPKSGGDTGCQEFTFDVQLPEDTKIFKLDFQIKPATPTPVKATSRTSTYLKFGNAIDVPAGPLNTLTGLGVDIKTSKNLIRRAIQQGRNLSDPVFLFKLASRFIPSPSPGGSANREVSGRPQDVSTDVPDLIAINTYWTFDPPIPADDTFAADLTFHYSATDLPDDPNFNESNLKVVSFDPVTGTLTRYSTTLDLANKTAKAHVENLAPVYSLAVFGPFSQSTLDFPVFQNLTNFNTEVTLVNPSPTAAVLNSQSFDPAGTPFGGAGVTNPSSMTLASGQQLSGPATQLFNMSSTEIAGWIQTRSNNNRVLGYELFGSGDRLDGLDIPQTRSTTVVLPDIEFNSNYTTEVHLANASNFSSNLTVELHSANGTVAGTYETSLAAKGQLIKNFDQMFPSIAKPFTGYIVVRSDQQMSAAELFVSNAELVALNAQPLVNAVSTPSTLYAARLVSDGSTIATRINLVNPTASNATVTLRSSDKNGSALAAPVNITLVAGQQYQRDIAQVFGFTPGLLTQGSLSVESSMTGLTGDVIYSDPAGTKPFRTGLALDDASTKPATFARVENGAGRFTEVYISNPNTQAAAVELAVFRPDGSQTGVKNIQVPAGGAVADQLGNLVPASIGQSGGYFVVSANQRVSAGAAFGTLNKTMLAAIPAQRLTTARKAISDFDGDGKSDLAVWREASGIWFVNASGNTPVTPFQFGAPGDVIIPGDYDGDGKADFAVWRQSSGLWYLQRSTAGFSVTQWGVSTDVPVPGDYDGDGKTDIAVWRPSSGIWFIINSSTGQVTATQWGVPTDKLVPGDYDGDGRTDLAVWRPSSGIWFIVQSSLGGTAFQFGAPTDKVIPADYDGDGKTDIAVYREGPQSLWYLQQSAAGFSVTQWGTTGDIPVPADYDGDGKADRTVWRPSNGIWFEQQSTSGFQAVQYGQAGDKLVPAAYGPPQ